jgi:oligoendopeptidase F
MEIKVNDTEWDLSPLTKGKNFKEKRVDWENSTKIFISKWKMRKDYLSDPKIMKEALEDYEKWKKSYGTEADEMYYYWLISQQDQINPEIKAKFNDVEAFSKKIENEIQFFTLKISKIPKKDQKIFLEEESLKNYKHFLERLFAQSKYILSEKEEKIINLKSSSSYSSWVKMTSGFLSKEEREVLNEQKEKEIKNFSEIQSLMNSPNQEIRDEAAKAFNNILDKYKETAEIEINSILLDKKVDDELRGLEQPEFSRHLSNDIDAKIVEKLTESIVDRFDISKRYYKLKSKILGVDKLEYHERNVEIGKIDKKYSYQEAVQLTNKVFLRLDPEFAEIFEQFIKHSQIDVFPKTGKRNGAFCVNFLLTQPVYVMLNYTGKLNEVLSLAHEMGHAINNELMKESQNSINFNSPTFTAEVASTFMEDFILEELMNQAEDKLKLILIMQKLNNDISSIMRQIACYKFEQEMHRKFREKGYLSYKEIGEFFNKNMFAYMGESVMPSKGCENWWISWKHIRRFFYNYSYASGLLISKYMQEEVRKDPKFIHKIKEFLSAGSSDSPENLFKKMNIDINNKEFWKQGINKVEALLNEAESLYKKISLKNEIKTK